MTISEFIKIYPDLRLNWTKHDDSEFFVVPEYQTFNKNKSYKSTFLITVNSLNKKKLGVEYKEAFKDNKHCIITNKYSTEGYISSFNIYLYE